ncbi:MAG: enoyl-CoA hydratase/isomerase family protein [Acidimicrobiales bacterium]
MIDLSRDRDVFVLRWDDGADNRFNATSIASLNDALDQVEGAAGPKALVVTGAGKFFSNGLDLDWMGSDRCDDVGSFLASVVQLMGRVLAFPAITVAAINGHAFAGGAMLAVAHDHRVMREDRGFWCTPEVDLGMRFAPGMNDVLVAKLPGSTAHRAMTLGHRYGGPEALEAGVVQSITTEDEVVSAAVDHAAQHVDKAGPVLAAIKRDLHPVAVASCAAGTLPPPLDE